MVGCTQSHVRGGVRTETAASSGAVGPGVLQRVGHRSPQRRVGVYPRDVLTRLSVSGGKNGAGREPIPRSTAQTPNTDRSRSREPGPSPTALTAISSSVV